MILIIILIIIIILFLLFYLMFQDGVVRHLYANQKDEFGIVTSTPDGAKISSMYRKPGVSADYTRKLADFFKDHVHRPPPEPASDIAARLARSLGFREFGVVVSGVGGKGKKPFGECRDPDVHKHVALLLSAMEEVEE
jgi:hypothetical protein